MRLRAALATAALVVPLIGFAAQVPAGAAAPGAQAPAAGPDLAKVCAKLARTPAKTPLCTHGPDELGALGGPEALTNAPADATPADLAVLCSDGGFAGRRIEVLYGVPSDRTNRYAQMLPTMLNVLAETDANLDASDADTAQHYRFLCENGTDVTIRNVTLLPVGTDRSFTFDDYTASLTRQVELGLGSVDFARGDRVYMTFVDQVTDSYPYGGQGSLYNDDRPDASLNYNNNYYAKYSMTAYYDAHVVGHEIGHNIGAVQNSAPHASGGYHCHDDYDLMCYPDGGSYFQAGGQMTYPCGVSRDSLMDCGQDDYYHPGTPQAGNYLATHWNTANSGYLTPLTASSAPTVPLDVTVEQGAESGSVVLRWSPPASDGGSPVTGYRVARDGVDAGGAGPWSTQRTAEIRSQTFGKLMPGSTYALSVAAVNAVGTGAAATVSVTVARVVTVPGVPTSVAGSADDALLKATLTWAPPAFDGGSPITGYRVSRDGSSSTGSGPWSTVRSADARSQVFGKLVPGSTYTLTVEALNAVGTGPVASTTVRIGSAGTRIEESAPDVTLGGWAGRADSAASGGSYRDSARTGSTASFTFSGTSVTWLSRKGPGNGVATVTIDGVSKGKVDLYSATGGPLARSFSGLAARKHTVVVKATGTRNAASIGYAVAVDGFTVGSATTQETAPTVRYDRWAGGTAAAASGGQYRVSAAAGDTIGLVFSGTAVDWVTATGPGWGRARVLIDGVDRGLIDLYAPTATWQVAKPYSGLAPGVHVLTVKVLGAKSASATSTKVPVDGFTVR